MSMPSDVTDDVTEAMERADLPKAPIRGVRRFLSGITTEQKGWFFAAFVAFLGVSYFGPTLARMTGEPTLRRKAELRAQAARRRAEKAYRHSRKRLRRLGGGSILR